MKDFNLKPTSSILKSVNLTKRKYRQFNHQRQPATEDALIKVTLHQLFADNQRIKEGIEKRCSSTIQHGLYDFLKDLSTALKLSEEQSPLLRDLIRDSFLKLLNDYQPMLHSFNLRAQSSIQPKPRSNSNIELTDPLIHRLKMFVHQVDQAFINIETVWSRGLIVDMEA